MNLKAFLTNCRSFLINSIGEKPLTQPKIHLVLGNEACDLDSVVSAVVYAYFLNSVNFKTSNIENTFLPILNTKHKSLQNKGEITYAFKNINIEPSNLICIDEIDFQKIKQNGKLVVTLVDHNVLATQNKFLTDDVVEIIDHHKNEMGNMYKSLTRTVIEPVGSCTTLIADEIISKEPNIINESKEIATLLYETILLDTNNLSEVTKKATEKDILMVKKLEDVLGNSNRQGVYDAILKARMDVSGTITMDKECAVEKIDNILNTQHKGLSFGDLLEQDLKVVSENGKSVAIPTVLSSLKNVGNLKQEMEKFNRENKHDAIVVMGVVVTDFSVSRELAIYTDEKLLKEIESALTDAENGVLKLKPITREPNFVLYVQENSQLSRKFILPIIREYLKSN